MSDDDQDAEKARKERSPSFPFISLEKAVDRLKEMANAHKRNPTRLVTVGTTWGYGAKSSGLLQTVSALRAFGLVSDAGGSGADRKIEISDLGWRILSDARPGAKETALKEAAFKPRLIAEYLPHWVPDRPSDAHCLSELQLDRGFTEAASKLFLKVFDETVRYADLKIGDSQSDSLEELTAIPAENSLEAEIPPMSGLQRTSRGWTSHHYVPEKFMRFAGGGEPAPSPPPTQRPQIPRATLPLPEGLVALEIPSNLSRKSFDAFKSWITTMISLSENSISSDWTVEFYRPDGTRPAIVQILPRWEIVKSLIDSVKQSSPDTLIRVIASEKALPWELEELESIGVRTF